MFPNKKGFFKKKDNWEDLGKIKIISVIENDKSYSSRMLHSFCNTVIHIGRENGELFRFCPKCMIKVKKQKYVKHI